ncbi:histidine kinase dimerization/phospho-acceptor domain-containing protein, partial [Flavobacterium sp.]|uniref:ATP-binding protein n=1 Tax=Flavobacterium sp. TaxID=239 RepID=UPI0037512A1A
MHRKLFIILLSLNLNLTFSQNEKKVEQKIDSGYFYIETANFNKNSKVFDKALENANKSIIYSQKNKNNFGIANGYFTLAGIYIDLKKYDDAIEKLIRAVSILNSISPTSKLALSYYNLGVCYLQKNNFERAESYFEKANSVYDVIDLSNAKQMINLQKALMYIDKNEDAIAEKALVEIAHLTKDNDIYKLQSEALYQLGLIKLKANINNLALNYFNRAYQISVENNKVEQQLKISKKLSEVYENLSETKKSLAFLKIHTKIKDSLHSNQKLTIKNIVSERAKVDEIMRSMEKMDKENKQQEKAGKFSKLINILSIALITILSLLSLSLYKNNIIRNKSNELLREKNSELEVATERIEKASKARAEFLSTVSHELRTPLNAINGISHILLDDEPKPSQIEYLKSLKFSGNYLLTYINEILEINRIESNNIEVENINFNLKELLHNIQNSLKEQASINNNDFD